MSRMLAAVGQLCSGGSPLANLSAAVSVIARGASAGAGAVLLPEASDYIAPAADVARLARSPENAAFLQGIKDAARKHAVEVAVGVHEPPPPEAGDEKRCYNTQVYINAQGEEVARYRKLHLFDVDIKGGLKVLESGTTIAGDREAPIVRSVLGQLGLLTCYDVRFPEVSLSLRRRGAEALTYPSAFTPRTGAAHWEVLLRARAIENQAYVLAPAQVGAHQGTSRASYGHAMVVDPWGSVVAQCSDMQPYEPTFCLAEIDLARLRAVRAEMPLWEQRRHDVYAEV